MSTGPLEEPRPRRDRDGPADIASTVMLSVAVVLTAFSLWQAALWDGEQVLHFERAETARLLAADDLVIALGDISYDAAVWADGLFAILDGDEETARRFEERLYSDEFRVALDAWLALDPFENDDAPISPLFVPEYRNDRVADWQRQHDEAQQQFEAGEQADEHGDDYILATVLFSFVLFFGGIGPTFRSEQMRLTAVVLAGTSLTIGSVWLVTLPRLGLAI